jgi:hypothetical protein
MPTRLTPKTSGASSSMTQGPTALASPAEGANTSRALKRRRKSRLKALEGMGWMEGTECYDSWSLAWDLSSCAKLDPGVNSRLAFGSFSFRPDTGRPRKRQPILRRYRGYAWANLLSFSCCLRRSYARIGEPRRKSSAGGGQLRDEWRCRQLLFTKSMAPFSGWHLFGG